jgi:hypothetical protein
MHVGGLMGALTEHNPPIADAAAAPAADNLTARRAASSSND